MNNIYDILNITNKDIESEIKDVIEETNIELNGLTKIRTCMIYSSKVSELLRKRNIVNRICNIKVNDDFNHQFVMVPYNNEESFIIDLTIEQFGNPNVLKELYDNGYILLDDFLFDNYYLKFIESHNSVKSLRKHK